MNIQDNDCHADAGDYDDNWDHIVIVIFKPEGIEDHGEEDELAQEGDDQGGGWDDLGQEEEEHCQGEQDGDGQGDLKPGRFQIQSKWRDETLRRQKDNYLLPAV